MKLIGASVVIVAMDTQWGVPYILLGREQSACGYGNSRKWTDFGGSAKPSETPARCAAREFHEETMGVVRWTDEEAVPRQSPSTVERSLDEHDFIYKLRIPVSRGKYYDCYVRQIPWQPNAPREFHRWRTQRNLAQTHPDAVDGRLSRDYYEKTQLKWWSVFNLRSLLEHKFRDFGHYFKVRLTYVLEQLPVSTVPTGRWTQIHGGTYTMCSDRTVIKETEVDKAAPCNRLLGK